MGGRLLPLCKSVSHMEFRVADKILLVEDESKIVRTLQLYLEGAGYQVTAVPDGALAMPAFRHERPDLVILDLMLPHVDGWELCRRMRGESAVPIIMLTARNEETDRIVGLELGADDYIAKPFSPREVVARVRAVLRRAHGMVQPAQRMQAGAVTVDLGRRSATVGERALDLTPMEFEILAALVRHPGQVFTRLQLLDALQDQAYEGYERAIDQHIKNLRTKLGDDARNPSYIATVYGVGYKFIAGEGAHA
jgi:DNA-binding response OmpR family regulator